MPHSKKFSAFLHNITLLELMGELLNIQFELAEVNVVDSIFQNDFQNSMDLGFYTQGLIIVSHRKNITRYDEILKKIVELTGTINTIEYVTALLSFSQNQSSAIEITLQVDHTLKPPKLVGTSQNELYFQVATQIRMRWEIFKQKFYQINLKE